MSTNTIGQSLNIDNRNLKSSNRLPSIDAFRGFVMLLIWADIFQFHKILKFYPDNKFWKFIVYHSSHVDWYWGSMHDMIQPAFTFLAGVSLPFSIAARIKKGDTKKDILLHAIKRSFVLIVIGLFLKSMWAEQTIFSFHDTLTMIGLGYTLLVLSGFTSQRNQIYFLIALLFLYWLAFALYPVPDAGFDFAKAGIPPTWQPDWGRYNATGFAAHWNYNTNLAWAFDKWFLNLFPQKKYFEFDEGGYYTLNFIPTIGTMIFGLFAGNILNTQFSKVNKLKKFIIIGVSLVLLGIILHLSGINHIIKRIWTPAFTIYSGGICFLFMAAFYAIVEIKGYVKWTFPLLVLGSNSIVAYILSKANFQMLVSSTLHTHLGQQYDKIFGKEYATIVNGFLIIFIMWYLLYWMYKKKVFIKV